MIKNIWLILGFIFVGCAQKIDISKLNVAPNWVQNPPVCSYGALCSIGVGYSQKGAIDEALSAISSQISVTVSSSLKSTRGYNDNAVFANAVSQVHSQTEAIEFKQFEIVQESAVGGKYYVALEVDKKMLFEDLLQDFNRQVRNQIQALKARNVYEQIKGAVFVRQQMPLLQSRLKILSSLQPYNPRILDQLNVRAQNILNKNFLCIEVKNDPRTIYATKLQSYFSHMGLQFKTHNCRVRVYLSNKTVFNEAYGFKVAKITTTIKFFEEGTQKSIFQVNSKGKSSLDKPTAYIQAAKSFEKKLKILNSKDIFK